MGSLPSVSFDIVFSKIKINNILYFKTPITRQVNELNS